MAEGRLLKNSISRDRRVAQLTDGSALLFTWAFSHADAEGRLRADPAAVREQVVPLRPWSDDQVDAFMAEWTRTTDEKTGLPRPLALLYDVDGCRVVAFTGWEKNQPLRFRRGARSQLPPPPAEVGQWASGQVGQWTGGPVDTAALSLRARAPGLGSIQEGVLQDSKPSSSLTNLEKPQAAIADARWLDEEFAAVFGRTPRPSKRDSILELLELADRVGRDAVREVIGSRSRMAPQSLAYFVQPLRDLAATQASTPPAERRLRPVPCPDCGVGGGVHGADCSRVGGEPADAPERDPRELLGDRWPPLRAV